MDTSGRVRDATDLFVPRYAPTVEGAWELAWSIS